MDISSNFQILHFAGALRCPLFFCAVWVITRRPAPSPPSGAIAARWRGGGGACAVHGGRRSCGVRVPSESPPKARADPVRKPVPAPRKRVEMAAGAVRKPVRPPRKSRPSGATHEPPLRETAFSHSEITPICAHGGYFAAYVPRHPSPFLFRVLGCALGGAGVGSRVPFAALGARLSRKPA